MANLVDRIIDYFSPERGAKRRIIRMGANYYTGARSDRMLSAWATDNSSADSTLDQDRDTLMWRARDLNRNNSIAAGITQTFCDNVIKTGIKPQSRIDYKAIGISEDQASIVQSQAETAYCKATRRITADSRQTIEQLQYLAMRQIVESGEFLGVRRSIRKKKPYMYAIDVVEPDRLETPPGAAGNVIFGVEKGSYGEPISYYIRKDHPGEQIAVTDTAMEYARVPAQDRFGRQQVYHLFNILRPGQTRGVPLFAPTMDTFKYLDDYMEGALLSARLAACYSAFIKVDNPYASAVARADDTSGDDRLETMEPGTIEYLGPNQDIVFSRPEPAGFTFDSFTQKVMRMIGAASGLPYELVLKDFSQTNYSSARAALLQAYRAFQTYQQLIIDGLCQPAWEAIFEEGVARGDIQAPNFYNFWWEYTRVSWIPPGWAWVDPLKEAQANQLELIMGTKTRADICADKGQDWEGIALQAARETKLYNDLGININGSNNPGSVRDQDTDSD